MVSRAPALVHETPPGALLKRGAAVDLQIASAKRLHEQPSLQILADELTRLRSLPNECALLIFGIRYTFERECPQTFKCCTVGARCDGTTAASGGVCYPVTSCGSKFDMSGCSWSASSATQHPLCYVRILIPRLIPLYWCGSQVTLCVQPIDTFECSASCVGRC